MKMIDTWSVFLFLSPALFGQSVVINEIAWMGTQASYSDEWIELYNLAADSIDLDHWTLQAADGTPNITLIGILPPSGFFILERTDDQTISDITANLIYTGDLGNTGEHLILQDASGQTIDEIDCSAGWFAGQNNPIKYSMEKTHPHAISSAGSNWASNNGLLHNGQDAIGNPMNATPGGANSALRTTYVADGEFRPNDFSLISYPNPFRESTWIVGPVAMTGLQLVIYDLLGRRIIKLAGGSKILWNGCDETGRQVASGIYICQMNDPHGPTYTWRLYKLE